MCFLQVFFRYLIIAIIGTALVYIFESVFQLSQTIWLIVGSIWTLIFIRWIVSPGLDGNEQKTAN